jgi:hypothetical protein
MCLWYIIQHHSQPLGLGFFFLGSGRVGSGFLDEKPRAADHVYSKDIYMDLPKERGPCGPG